MIPPDLHARLNEARREMLEQQCRGRGIRDERVLAAMAEVPRERFVREDLVAEAYSDRALPIDCGQTISQPYIVAVMTEELDLRPDHLVLEVGTGSGYQCAVLSRLARQVITIERLPELSERARGRLEALGVRNVRFIVGDGSAGWPEAAPYNRIIVTAGTPAVPPALLEQIVPGGRLVAPVGGSDTQTLVVIERQEGRTVERPLLPCRFVKLVGRDGWSEA